MIVPSPYCFSISARVFSNVCSSTSAVPAIPYIERDEFGDDRPVACLYAGLEVLHRVIPGVKPRFNVSFPVTGLLIPHDTTHAASSTSRRAASSSSSSPRRRAHVLRSYRNITREPATHTQAYI